MDGSFTASLPRLAASGWSTSSRGRAIPTQDAGQLHWTLHTISWQNQEYWLVRTTKQNLGQETSGTQNAAANCAHVSKSFKEQFDTGWETL